MSMILIDENATSLQRLFRRPIVEERLFVVPVEQAAADGQSDRWDAPGGEEDAHVLPRRPRHQRAVALRHPQGKLGNARFMSIRNTHEEIFC